MKSLLTKDLLQDLMITAKKNLEKDGSCLPVLHVLANGKVLIFGISVNDLIDRRKLFSMIGNKVKEDFGGVDEAVFICESWYYKTDKGKPYEAIRPSQHPDRMEAVMIMGRDKSGKKQKLIMQPFTKVKGKYVYHKKDISGKKGDIAGIMDYIFNPAEAELRELSFGMTKPKTKH